MKNILILFTVVLLTIFSFGCSKTQLNYGMDAAIISADYSVIKSHYKSMKGIVGENWDVIEEKDKESFLLIDENVRRITEKTEQLLSKDFYRIPTAEISYMYILAKDTYAISKEMYVKYEGTLTRSEAFALQMFDERLKDLDREIVQFLDNPDYDAMNNIASNILGVGSQAVRLVLPLLL